MNREIKFRGMLENGEWVYGGYVKIIDGANCILSGECHHCESDGKTKNVLSFNAVKYKTVGEFTGLKDKNGKGIWEGDRVNLDRLNNEEMHGEVEYSDNLAAFIVRISGYRSLDPFPLMLVEMGTRSLEVIGSIYENPKLLEGKDND